MSKSGSQPSTGLRGGRVKGSQTYTRQDIEAIFDCIEQTLPIGPDEWTIVLNQYVTIIEMQQNN